MRRCLGCGGARTSSDDEEPAGAEGGDPERELTPPVPGANATKTEPPSAAAETALSGTEAMPEAVPEAVSEAKPEDGGRPAEEGQPAAGSPKTRNLMGLRVDASVDAELAELGMDASVLLEPLTPRSLITSTPYPGKRSSVVLDAMLEAGGLDGVFDGASLSSLSSSSSPPAAAATLPRDELPAMTPREHDGTQEPPATPVGRDELALRRHRFFADLLDAAKAAAEHRVRFDPRGPVDLTGEPVQLPLEDIVSRLENVTGRLERSVRAVESALLFPAAPASPAPPLQPQQPQQPQQAATLPPATAGQPKSGKAPSRTVTFDFENVTMSISAFQDILAGPLAQYLALSAKIGGDVAEQANNVRNAFNVQLKFLETAASRPKPSNQAELMTLLTPTSQLISTIQDHREKKRASPQFNHLSTISESIPALGWVTVSPAPSPFVKEMKDAGMFYGNRVLKDFKDRDRSHVDWVNAWIQTLVELQDFVKKHHTTGLEWQPARAGGAPPPPPPAAMPPPPPVLPEGDLANLSLDPAQDRSALFAQINQGENITRSLKKVTSEMQTHKNPALRTGPAPTEPAKSSGGRAVAAASVDKPPSFTREGKKWLIEYQKDNKNLVVEGAEMNNVVYMFKCVGSTLVVKGKINSIVMDSCKKSAVVFDTLVSSVEFVNCQSVQMQVTGVVPTITIDKTDGCQMYLSEQSLNVEIVSSKSSEMNVLVPSSSGDYVEYAIPEQYRTKVSKGGLTTSVVESLG